MPNVITLDPRERCVQALAVLSAPPDALGKIGVLLTAVGGEVCHRA